MIVLRIDSIPQAVSIERGDKQRIYCPKPASMKRLEHLAQGRQWIYLPTGYPGMHAWQFVNLSAVNL